VPFELIATSRKDLSLVVDAESLTPEFLNRLSALARVDVQVNRALVTLVGQNVSKNPSNLARASRQLRELPGGALLGWCSDSRFAFVLAEEDLNSAAEALHSEFFGQPDPAFLVPNRTSVMLSAACISPTPRPLEVCRPSGN